MIGLFVEMVRNESRGSQGYLRSGLGGMQPYLEEVAETFIDAELWTRADIRYVRKDLVFPVIDAVVYECRMVIIYFTKMDHKPNGIFLQAHDMTSLVFTQKTLIICGTGKLFTYDQAEELRKDYENFYIPDDENKPDE